MFVFTLKETKTFSITFIASLQLVFFNFWPTGHAFTADSNRCQTVTPRYSSTISPCNKCTQFYFTPDTEILVSAGDDSLYYRKADTDKFSKTPHSLAGPHSIVYLPRHNVFYVCDTENDRIVALSSLSSGKIDKEIKSLDGIPLRRPHDIVYDQLHDVLYAINPLEPTIFQFRHNSTVSNSLDLSAVLDYSRSLSLIDGVLYISGSSLGKIIKITNFETGEFEEFQSPHKIGGAHSGNWQENGLIINDLEKYNGYWHISSYFHPASSTDQDYNYNKFIRFSSWEQFESGNWQDLSHLLPDGMVPYYLTQHDNKLLIAVFSHEYPGIQDNIYALSSPCSALPATLFSLLK